MPTRPGPHAPRAVPLVLAAVAACGPVSAGTPAPAGPSPAPTQGTPAGGPQPQTPWDGCYASFDPQGDPVADLRRLARGCGAANAMKPMTAIHTGEQSQAEPVQRVAFHVPAAGRCYRIYAVGDSGIQDLDLLVRDPAGNDVIGDVSHDAWPVVPPRGPACFDAPGVYVLEVSVYRGAGKYALQIWGK
jgi:hypothetical protein